MPGTDLLKRIVVFSHPSGMQLVNGIDPGVSKTQPLATFLHRSAVQGYVMFSSNATTAFRGTSTITPAPLLLTGNGAGLTTLLS